MSRSKLNKPMPMRHLGGPKRTDAEFRKAMEDRRKAKEGKNDTRG